MKQLLSRSWILGIVALCFFAAYSAAGALGMLISIFSFLVAYILVEWLAFERSRD